MSNTVANMLGIFICECCTSNIYYENPSCTYTYHKQGNHIMQKYLNLTHTAI